MSVNHASPTSASPEASKDSANPNKTFRRRIVVVDDDVAIAMELFRQLNEAGYEVTVAFDAVAGAKAAIRTDPHLILLDVFMTRGGGFFAAEGIKTLLIRKVPIVIMTGSPDPRVFENAVHMGATAFLAKPFMSDELLTIIRQTLKEPVPAGTTGRA